MARLARGVVPGLPHPITQRGDGCPPVFFRADHHVACRELRAERSRPKLTGESDIFRKPWIGGIYGVRAKEARHPYDRRLFREYPVFPLFVLDTGAFLLCTDKLGAADGDAMLRAVTDGSLFEHWTHQGRFDWDLSFKQTR